MFLIWTDGLSDYLTRKLPVCAVKVKMHKEMSIHKHLLYDWASATKSWCLPQWSKANPNSMELALTCLLVCMSRKTHYHCSTHCEKLYRKSQCSKRCFKNVIEAIFQETHIHCWEILALVSLRCPIWCEQIFWEKK